MSQALKCDRCKVCFDPWTATDDFTKLDNIILYSRQSWSNNEVEYRDEEFHMCPDCTKEFLVFLSTDVVKRDRSPTVILKEMQKLANELWPTANLKMEDIATKLKPNKNYEEEN